MFPDGTVQRLLANGDMVIEYTNGQRECHTADYKVATCLMNYSCRIPTLAHEHSWYLTTEAALPRWYNEDRLPRWPARDEVCLWPAEGQGQRRTCASGHLAAAAAAAAAAGAGLSFLDTHTHIPPLFCTPYSHNDNVIPKFYVYRHLVIIIIIIIIVIGNHDLVGGSLSSVECTCHQYVMKSVPVYQYCYSKWRFTCLSACNEECTCLSVLL